MLHHREFEILIIPLIFHGFCEAGGIEKTIDSYGNGWFYRSAPCRHRFSKEWNGHKTARWTCWRSLGAGSVTSPSTAPSAVTLPTGSGRSTEAARCPMNRFVAVRQGQAPFVDDEAAKEISGGRRLGGCWDLGGKDTVPPIGTCTLGWCSMKKSNACQSFHSLGIQQTEQGCCKQKEWTISTSGSIFFS